MQNRLELYQKAVPLAKLGIWERNLVTGDIYWNKVMKEIYEVSDDFRPDLDKSLSFYVDAERMATTMDRAIETGKEESSKFRIFTAKAKLKWVKVRIQANFENGICNSLFGTLEDVTEKENMQSILEEREKRFFQAFDHAPIGMALLSLKGEWLKVNSTLCFLLGYEEPEFSQFNIQELAHTEDLDHVVAAMEKLLASESSSFNLELRLFHKNGTSVWVMLSQSLVRGQYQDALYFIAHIKDISESRKHTEILLRERLRLDNIIKATGVGTWEWDLKTDQLLSNHRTAKLLGYDPHELKIDYMRDWQLLIHPDDRENNLLMLQDCFQRKTKFYCCECRMQHKDREYIWMEIRGKVIEWSETGEPMFMLGTCANIHERKSMVERQNKAIRIISEQNRRLLDFAHIVSHNLRSHAGNIQMLVEVMANESDPNEHRELMDMLGINVTNLQQTLSHLNEAVKVQDRGKTNSKKLNLLSEIHKTLHTLSESIKRSAAVIQILVDENTNITFDPAYLESILLNLLSNCIKYRHPERQLKIDIIARGENPTVLKVTDNGIGIDLKMHGHKLFGMYKTFHGNADARGIGLFLVKNQVEAMEGNIKAQSKVGAGTTFTLELN